MDHNGGVSNERKNYADPILSIL